jgi:hypothetical protein
VDQRPDEGDQQHERHRERVDEQPAPQLERARRHPVEQVQVRCRASSGALEQRRRQDAATTKAAHEQRGAEQRPDALVGAAEQQDGGAEQRQRDEQPGRETPVRRLAPAARPRPDS